MALLAEYHGSIDLLDLWTGKLTLRRLSVAVEHLRPGNAIDRAINAEVALWTSGEITPYILAAVHGIDTPGQKSKKRSRVDQVKESKRRTAAAEQPEPEPSPEADGQLVPSFGGDIRKQALAYRDLINRRKAGDNG